MNDVGIHQAHCCIRHTCKYGEENCPVKSGQVIQKYPCMDCKDEEYMLFLDDLRTPVSVGLTIVRSYEQCIEYLDHVRVKFISLDHDLGTEKSGYDVAKYIVEHRISIPYINIHTMNVVGGDNMQQLLQHYCLDSFITRYKNW